MSTSTTDSGVSLDWHLPVVHPHDTKRISRLLPSPSPSLFCDRSSRPTSPRPRAGSAPPSLSSDSPRDFSKETTPKALDMVVVEPEPGRSAGESDEALLDKPRIGRPVSLGNTYGFSSVGKGFDWRWGDNDKVHEEDATPDERDRKLSVITTPPEATATTSAAPPLVESPKTSSRPATPATRSAAASTPGSPRPTARRRDTQKRISLVAGRLSMITIERPPSPPRTPSATRSPRLSRFGSGSSMRSIVSAAPPTPRNEPDAFIGGRSIDDFIIDGEAGRGAYGIVKRGRERLAGGSYGPPIIIKQVVKSRILADCWKRHPRLGTIPIEIYVMSAISATPYTLPPRRPWDPQRTYVTGVEPSPDTWKEGTVIQGHPNICPLIDFWEDAQYYYLLLPSATPPPPSNGRPSHPSDLFDLVELYPYGLPPPLIRSYLGQLADALAFLHSKGIVHRDVKDENVVLGQPEGKCILIDFGSSGVVKRAGWDTFSGTLDYAGPEILRGERYMGKEQDVWAFGVVAFVLLIGECPFATAAEAQDGLSLTSKAARALTERCGGDKSFDGLEPDGGGCLADAASLVHACLQLDIASRPTVEMIMNSRFLYGAEGWTSLGT